MVCPDCGTTLKCGDPPNFESSSFFGHCSQCGEEHIGILPEKFRRRPSRKQWPIGNLVCFEVLSLSPPYIVTLQSDYNQIIQSFTTSQQAIDYMLKQKYDGMTDDQLLQEVVNATIHEFRSLHLPSGKWTLSSFSISDVKARIQDDSHFGDTNHIAHAEVGNDTVCFRRSRLPSLTKDSFIHIIIHELAHIWMNGGGDHGHYFTKAMEDLESRVNRTDYINQVAIRFLDRFHAQRRYDK